MLSEVFYSECLFCKQKISFTDLICEVCFNNFERITFSCHKCGYPLESDYIICRNCFQARFYEKIMVSYWYNYEMRTLLKYYKFHYGFKNLKIFERLLSGLCIEDNYHIVTPVPVYISRRLVRLIQPAYYLSKIISKKFGIPYKTLLKRVRFTEYQWKLKRNLRIKNIKGAFECMDDVKGLKILLVDDIITTGATINECARILKKSGAKRVDIFCLSKGMFL
ncbi:ComF family protein [Deferribacter autotrophicus]|uniref:ComF family protein n=1 Tax=Deferribacter autotrophicus TaxID=500465 RepID=A0A5A8F4U0_9BACT|nr:ComF family protein [Deferribacter autotrophicus]KAA0258506.1 ComF family protein [Deferribacter autotrophicus]